ncbi:MAG TPA: ABC transporter permease subunit [Nocardioidaceae bacterium]|nr:ABC transporter permease subunit [Nocardioidaceae bacterium]
MSDVRVISSRSGTPAWTVVAGRELRDLWLSGRGLVLMLAHTALLSTTTYLVATNQELNFLEQREAVSLSLQVAVAVGSLLVVLGAADALSGERERGSLESLLLTPAPRHALLLGKGIAAFSLWLGAFALAIPYLWWLGRDVGTFGTAVGGGFLVGSLLALALVGVGLLISTYSTSNAASLSLSFFVLLALYAPSQMPTASQRGWAGELLVRADPFTSGLLYLERLLVNQHSFGQNLELLLSPAIAALAAPIVVVFVAARLALLPRERS